MVRLTDRPDMTLDVYRGRKTTNQQSTLNFIRPYQEYFGHTRRCEDDIMKGWLQLNKMPPSVGLKPGIARSAGQR